MSVLARSADRLARNFRHGFGVLLGERAREDTHSEKAESIKSRLIEAISRMDDTDLDKLRSVLKLEQNTEMAGRLKFTPAEMTEENLKKLDEINDE